MKQSVQRRFQRGELTVEAVLLIVVALVLLGAIFMVIQWAFRGGEQAAHEENRARNQALETAKEVNNNL